VRDERGTSWIEDLAQDARFGFRTLRRFTGAAQLNGDGHYDAQPTIAATAHTDDRHSSLRENRGHSESVFTAAHDKRIELQPLEILNHFV